MMASIIGGSIAVVVVAGIIAALAFALRSAEQRCADARVGEATKAGQLAIGAAEIATWKLIATKERDRANALDDLLDEVATSGDAAGARSRVLSRWARDVSDVPATTAGHNDHDAVPPTPAPEPTKLGDDLITPGQ